MGFHATAFRYAFIVALGGFVFGLDAALISGTVRFVTVEFGLSDMQIGAVVSARSPQLIAGFGVDDVEACTIRIRRGRMRSLIVDSIVAAAKHEDEIV